METVCTKWTSWVKFLGEDACRALVLARERGYDVEFRICGPDWETDLYVRLTRGGSYVGTARVTHLRDGETLEAREFDARPGPLWQEAAELVKLFATVVFADLTGGVPFWAYEEWTTDPRWFNPNFEGPPGLRHDDVLSHQQLESLATAAAAEFMAQTGRAGTSS